jgi:hypothetical protein
MLAAGVASWLFEPRKIIYVSKSAISIKPTKNSIDIKILKFVGSINVSILWNRSLGFEFASGGNE